MNYSKIRPFLWHHLKIVKINLESSGGQETSKSIAEESGSSFIKMNYSS